MNNCQIYNLNKYYKLEQISTAGKYESDIPFEKVSIFIKGLILTDKILTNFGELKFNILVITDIHSRFSKIAILKKIKTNEIIKAIEKEWIKYYDKQKILLSDQGRQFISIGFKNYMDDKHIKHITTTPYNPVCNVTVGRINKVIGEILRIMRGKNIKELKDVIHNRLNHIWHSNIEDTVAPWKKFKYCSKLQKINFIKKKLFK